jgi:hypothetical protein
MHLWVAKQGLQAAVPLLHALHCLELSKVLEKERSWTVGKQRVHTIRVHAHKERACTKSWNRSSASSRSMQGGMVQPGWEAAVWISTKGSERPIVACAPESSNSYSGYLAVTSMAVPQKRNTSQDPWDPPWDQKERPGLSPAVADNRNHHHPKRK